MRGKRKLYEKTKPGTSERQERLHQRECLWSARYYFYAYLVTPRLGYDDIIITISREMGYFSPRTLSDTLMRCHAEIQKLQAEQASPADLSARYPWLVWQPYEQQTTINPAQTALSLQ